MANCWEGMYQKDKWARERVIRSVRMLLPHLKDGDVVLDVGCFTQEARKYLPSSIRYVGIDSFAYHPDTIVCDLNKDFPTMHTNHALCLETFEHLVHPKYTLHSIYENLSQGGFLVVSLPNEASVFHRLRCLLGTVDAECFVSEGKHLHLPSLQQARKFLEMRFRVVKTEFYVSPSAHGSRQAWVGKILSLIPVPIHQALANLVPSLFARGFIFLCIKKQSEISI